MSIIKSQNPKDIPEYDKEYWHAKTPEERLEAARKLILRTKAIYKANPKNPPFNHGGRILKSRTPIERRDCPAPQIRKEASQTAWVRFGFADFAYESMLDQSNVYPQDSTNNHRFSEPPGTRRGC